MERFLGIDTSCYTTSVAVYDASEGLIGEERVILHVKDGQRGLSQSNMVFQHVRNLPLLFRKLSPMIQNIRGIGVSAFPRRRADSYMPAFLVGKNFGESLAVSLDVPIYFFSHQENHAMAAIRETRNCGGIRSIFFICREVHRIFFPVHGREIPCRFLFCSALWILRQDN